MTEQKSEHQRKRTKSYPIHHSNARVRLLVTLLASTLMVVACGAPPAAPADVTVQVALPTSTLEPTFTPSPPSTNTPRPSPTATPAEPTLTPSSQSALSGRILDQDINQPIAGAEVSVGAATATTDADGRYTLTGLPPGQYVLSVTHPDYDPGLSSIFTLTPGQEHPLDLALYAPKTSPYPKDPMLTNPLDPNGVPTAEDAEQLAREQGLTGEVVSLRETKLSGEYLVNYKIGDEVRAAVAELDHDVWELTDDAGRQWWIIKVCGNLASTLPAAVAIATPQPRPLPPMAEVLVDELVVKECALEKCAEVGTVQQGARVEVIGCLSDDGWCQVEMPGGERGWCTGSSLRQLAVAEAIQAVDAMLPTATPGVVTAEGKIAFSSNRDGNYEIYVINTDGSGLTRITNHPANDHWPTWSPDGRQIAFTRDDHWDIYVINADGSNEVRLTDGHDPVWSPDGQQIAFASARDGNLEIYTMNVDGSGLTRLTNHLDPDEDPTWSPNGQQIAFTSHRDASSWNAWDLYVMNADGGGLIHLTNSSADDTQPVWSPNGRHIAFHSSREPGWGIYIINTDGSGLTRLADGESPTWSPDSRQVAFFSSHDGNLDIYLINIDGSGLTRLTDHPAFDINPDWSRR
jgi:hypothetical protein